MRIVILIISAVLTGCVGSQVYNPSLMVPGQNLEPGQARIHVSGGPAPLSHSDDVTTFSTPDFNVQSGEPLPGSFAFIGDATLQIGLQNNHTLSVRGWTELATPINRWGIAVSDLFWIKLEQREGGFDFGIQPSFTVVGDQWSAQGWGIQLAGITRYRHSETLGIYGGIAPLYGRIPQLPINYIDRAANLGIENPRPDGWGIGLHVGAEYEFIPRLTGRVDINFIAQRDNYYREFNYIPCFTLGVGFSLFPDK
jgi:hypothetical protein